MGRAVGVGRGRDRRPLSPAGPLQRSLMKRRKRAPAGAKPVADAAAFLARRTREGGGGSAEGREPALLDRATRRPPVTDRPLDVGENRRGRRRALGRGAWARAGEKRPAHPC